MTRKEALVLLNKHASLQKENEVLTDACASKIVIQSQIIVVEQLMLDLNIGWTELRASYERQRNDTAKQLGKH